MKASRQFNGLSVFAVIVLAMPTAWSADSTQDERAIGALLTRFYDGWNAHDVAKMVSVYSDDIDHINTFARWNRGKSAIADDLKNHHAGPGKNSRKTFSVEKIRFIKPDVAVVQVRSISTGGNIGTYVLTKDTGDWLVVSFTNVGYALTQDPPE